MRARNVTIALVLMAIGGLLFTVAPALAGWTQRQSKVLPPKTASFTVTALACNDQTSHTVQSNTVQLEMWNTSAVRDVCIAWTGTPDYSDVTSCDVILGAYAGSGSPSIYQTPPTLGFSGTTFKCDANGATTIRISEFVGPSAY